MAGHDAVAWKMPTTTRQTCGRFSRSGRCGLVRGPASRGGAHRLTCHGARPEVSETGPAFARTGRGLRCRPVPGTIGRLAPAAGLTSAASSLMPWLSVHVVHEGRYRGCLNRRPATGCGRVWWVADSVARPLIEAARVGMKVRGVLPENLEVRDVTADILRDAGPCHDGTGQTEDFEPLAAHTIPLRQRWHIDPDGTAGNSRDGQTRPGQTCRISHYLACPRTDRPHCGERGACCALPPGSGCRATLPDQPRAVWRGWARSPPR
ncbi:DUF6083 domain-containing protein [Streptomyces sp. NPDC048155]|uniref:DUF6083 domain-containing protein n=1 Tax=Streptomyces sp. NPDC048155 TaxID=3154818 RepID=UPI0033EC8F66